MQTGIKAIDDLADLASDELTEPVEGVLRAYDLSEEQANEIIMAARAHWFADEEDKGSPQVAEPGEEAAEGSPQVAEPGEEAAEGNEENDDKPDTGSGDDDADETVE